MSDDLRSRIAAVAQNHVRCDECTFAKTPAERYLHFADAVIRELKLEVEDGECGYCRAQLPGCRYVTEWEKPE